MLDAFLEENPDATEEDLYLALGSPEELAEQMMEECEITQARYSKKQYINKLAATSIIIFVSLLFACVVHQYLIVGKQIQIEVNPIKYVYLTDEPKSLH